MSRLSDEADTILQGLGTGADSSGDSGPGLEAPVLGERAGVLSQKPVFFGGKTAKQEADNASDYSEKTHHVMTGPDGSRVLVPEDEVRAAMGQKFREATDSEKAAFKDEQQKHSIYGGWAGQTLAATMGVLRGMTLGTSDVALAAAGRAQDTYNVKEENPTISGVGEFAGAAALAAATGGAGGALEAGAAGVAEGAVGRGLVSKLVGLGVRGAAEGAVFGGGGQVSEAAINPNFASEAVLSNIGTATLFGGGLGVAGGLVEVGARPVIDKVRGLISKSSNVAEQLGVSGIARVAGRDKEELGEMLAAKLDPERRARLGAELATSLDDTHATLGRAVESDLRTLDTTASREAAEAQASVVAKRLEELEATVKNVPKAKAVVSEARSAMDDLDMAMMDEPPAAAKRVQYKDGKIYGSIQEAASANGTSVSKIRSSIEGYGRTERGLWSYVAEQVPDAAALGTVRIGGKVIPSDAYRSLAQAQAALSKGAAESPVLKETAEQIKTLLGAEKVWGKAGVRLSELGEVERSFHGAREAASNFRAAQTAIDPRKASPEAVAEYLNRAKSYIDSFERGGHTSDFAREDLDSLVSKTSEAVANHEKSKAAAQLMESANGGPGGIAGLASSAGKAMLGHAAAGPIGAAIGVIHTVATGATVPKAVAALARIHGMAEAASRRLDTIASIITSASPKAMNVARGEIAAGLASRFGSTPDRSLARYKKESEKVRLLANDPESLQQHATDLTADWNEHAPNTAQAAQIKMAQNISWLASHLPASRKSGMLGPDIDPSEEEVAKGDRYLEAFQNPIASLRRIAAGMGSQESIDTVKACYPELYAETCAKAVSKCASKKSVSYEARQNLATLLGQDVDGSMSPVALMANKTAYADPQKDMEDKTAPIKGASRITIGNRTNTGWHGGIKK
jgi:hypothetical protein